VLSSATHFFPNASHPHSGAGGDGCLSNLVEEARAAHERAVDMLQQATGEAAADVEGHN